MRKYLLASAVAIAAFAAPSFADVTVTRTVEIDGNIALKCTLSISHTTLTLGDITTDAAGKHGGGLTNATVFLDGSAMCNGSKNIVDVVALPLTTTTPVGSGFTNRIDYALNVGGLLPGPVSLTTAGAPLTGAESNQTNVAAFANTGAGASFLTLPTTQPVMAGDYNATVTVTVTAGN